MQNNQLPTKSEIEFEDNSNPLVETGSLFKCTHTTTSEALSPA